ncbi:VOC family protein [Mycobacterium sp. NPDC003323]
MSDSTDTRGGAAVPAGSNTVNPFIFAESAIDLIDFLIAVLDARDVPEARTLDDDGLILHAELRVGDSLVTIADRKPGWPFTPAFVRAYVSDAEATIRRAEAHGGVIVTRPTEFFGDVLARFVDPAGNLWWIYEHIPADSEPVAASDEAWGADADWHAFSTPELDYIHRTLMQAMDMLSARAQAR